jgi:hypothetical protein
LRNVPMYAFRPAPAAGARENVLFIGTQFSILYTTRVSGAFSIFNETMVFLTM